MLEHPLDMRHSTVCCRCSFLCVEGTTRVDNFRLNQSVFGIIRMAGRSLCGLSSVAFQFHFMDLEVFFLALRNAQPLLKIILNVRFTFLHYHLRGGYIKEKVSYKKEEDEKKLSSSSYRTFRGIFIKSDQVLNITNI